MPLAAAAVVVAAGWSWVVAPGTPYGDDNSAHYAVVGHIARLWEAGHTDLWWHQSNLGLPLFAAYQPLPALAVGTLTWALDGLVQPTTVFKASILGAWALMPLAWARGARAFGLPAAAAVAVGLLTLVVHDPDNIGLTVRSSTARGLYTQHFGLILLPLALAAFWRAVDRPGARPWTAGVLLAMTGMAHLFIGLYAGVAILALLAADPGRLRARARMTAAVASVGATLSAWWLVPLIATNHLAGGLPWRRELHDGWPLWKTIGLLLTGRVFDTGRLPLLTALVVGGAVLLFRAARRPGPARVWAVLTALTAVLFLGRTNLGALYELLPLHGQVNVMRYITGVHICGLLAAGAAVEGSRQWVVRRWGGGAARGLGAAAILGLLAFAALDIRGTLRSYQPNHTDLGATARQLAEMPDHRIAVHGDLGTGNHFHRDLLPALADRGQLQSYAHGYHCTLSTYYAEYFDFSPAACQLYDIGAIVARAPLPGTFPMDAYTEAWRGGDTLILEPAADLSGGLFDFVQLRGRIAGPDLRAIRPAVRTLAVPMFARGTVAAVARDRALDDVQVNVDGKTLPWSPDDAETLLDHIAPATPARGGQVVSWSRGLSSYTADVDATEDGAHLLLKVNFFPWWRARVDGGVVPITHVTPNFMVVQVPQGRHQVTFSYHNPPLQKAGAAAALGGVVLWALAAAGAGWRRRRAP